MVRGFPLMATDNDSGARQRVIATAIAAELGRQAEAGTQSVDIDALAKAIDVALDPPLPLAEGKHPGELNSTNDD